MGTPQKVSVLVGFEGSFGNFVDAMSALAVFCSQITNLNITFFSPQVEYFKAAKSYWFIKNVVSEADPSKFNYVVNLVSDRDSATRYEMAYRGSIKRNIDSQILHIAQQKGVPPEQVQKPPGYEIIVQPNPIYNRQHSYLITLIYELLTPCNIPYDIPTLMPTSSGTKEIVNKMLHQNRERLKPSIPYILITNGEMLGDRGLQIPYPETWGVLMADLNHVEAHVVAGLVTNPRCIAVVSKVGELGRIAAIHNTPCIIEIADNKDTMSWDCTRNDNCMILEVSEEFAEPEKFMAATTSHIRTCFGYNNIS